MKPKLENFPGGSRSPDVLAAEAARSARDPFPRECLGWSECLLETSTMKQASRRVHGQSSAIPSKLSKKI